MLRTALACLVSAIGLAGCGFGAGGTGSFPFGCQLTVLKAVGTSMAPTINDGDLLCTAAPTSTLTRGQIAAFIPPTDPSALFIKRVIGLPGDVIEIDGSQQPTHVLIKPGGKGPWQLLLESYVPQPWTALNFCCDPDGRASAVAQPYTVPAGYYFVMGDNRNFSSDSRSFGPVLVKNVEDIVTGDLTKTATPSASP